MSNVQSKKMTPQIRFKSFLDEWSQKKYTETFDTSVSNNTLSRSELTTEKTSTQNVHYGDVLIKFDSILDVRNNEIPYIPENIKIDSKNLLKNGDIVFADTAEDETCGKATELNNVENEKIVAGLHTFVARPKINFEPKYLGYFINSPAYHNQLLPFMQGTKVTSISKTSIQKTWVNYPSSTEQSKIGSLFSQIDSLIASTQKEHDKLVTLKKCMLQKMFPKKGSLAPEIRFKGFSEDWEEKRLEEVCKENLKPIPTPKNVYYRLGIRSHAKGTFHEKVLAGHGLDVDTMYIVEKDNLIVNITFAWEHAIAITDMDDEGKLVSHRFPQYKFNNDQCPSFYKYSILDNKFREKLQLASPGGAGRNRVLNLKQFKKITRIVPKSFKEQQKIGSYFQNLDNLISKQAAELEKLKNVKKTLLSKMFV